MNRIVPHALWIGSTGDLRDVRQLYDAGIRAVVQFAYEEAPIGLPRDFIACRFPLVDGADNEPELLRAAIYSVTHLLEEKFATLLCCQAGLSRSSGIAAAALARQTGEPIDVCLAQIAKCRPVQIHSGLLAQLESLCRTF